MDRARFFDAVRDDLFGGRLADGQVAGLTAHLDAWEGGFASQTGDQRRQLAYALATSHHETARFTLLHEIGRGQGHKYGVPDPETGLVYYGRGPSMLTWRRNYEVMGRRLGLDLVHHPELAAEWPAGTRILFEGMVHGLFTGWKLDNFFTLAFCDWHGARRIINALDRADLVATYARDFWKAIEGAGG